MNDIEIKKVIYLERKAGLLSNGTKFRGC